MNWPLLTKPESANRLFDGQEYFRIAAPYLRAKPGQDMRRLKNHTAFSATVAAGMLVLSSAARSAPPPTGTETASPGCSTSPKQINHGVVEKHPEKLAAFYHFLTDQSC